MAGAEDPLLVGQQSPEQGQRPGGVPALAGPGGDVVPGGQGAGVAAAEDPFLVGQQPPEQGQRPGRGLGGVGQADHRGGQRIAVPGLAGRRAATH